MYELLVNKSKISINNILSIFWFVIVIFIIGISFFVVDKKLNNYIELNGVVIEENIISLLIQPTDIDIILNTNEMLISDKKYTFGIFEIKEENIIDDQNIYKELIINSEIDKKYNFKNNVLSIKIKKESKNIFEKILKYWRGNNN